MIAERPSHKQTHSISLAGRPETMICDADCPACADQRQIDAAVRHIVLEMWVSAVESGERTVEAALREGLRPISMMSEFERNKVGWSFTRRVLAARPVRTRARKPRGLPTAWVQANRDLVDVVHEQENLPKNNVDLADDFGLANAFPRVAEIWERYGIVVTAHDVKNAYYRE